jgi:hypothetical protein
MSSIRTLFHEQLARLVAESGRRGRVSGELTALPGADKRWYGHARGEMGKDMPPAGNGCLSSREVDAVVRYLFAKAAGRGPATYEDCIELFAQGHPPMRPDEAVRQSKINTTH